MSAYRIFHQYCLNKSFSNSSFITFHLSCQIFGLKLKSIMSPSDFVTGDTGPEVSWG